MRPRVFAARAFSPEIEAALDAAVRAELRDALPFAGLSVGVQQGTRRWTAAYGFRDLARRLRATPTTSYRFASITKSFTATAVMQLVERGRLELDQEIHSLVPYYPHKRWPITVRQLLGHLSGVPHYANAADGRNVNRVSTREAIALFADKPLYSEPGTAFVYTTWGYDLLGAAVEAASGEPYGTYLKRYVFGPAGMTTAALDDFRTRGPEQAVGYRRRGNRLVRSPYLDVSSRFAGGGTRGTVLDLLAFGRATLHHRLVRPDTAAQMQTVMQTRDGRFTDYGMGFATFPRHGQYLVAHAGGQPETTTLLVLLPADEVIIALATNLEGQGDLLRRIQIRIAELLLEEGHVRRGAYAKDPADRGVFEGLYRVFSYGVAYHRWATRSGATLPGASDEELEGAFAEVRRLLSRAHVAADPRAHRERLRQAHEPHGGEVILRVGVEMARTIARWFGPGALRREAAAGPFGFFADYAAACEALQCPAARRFEGLSDDIERLRSSWEEGMLRALERTRLSDVPDPEALWPSLERAVANSTFHPDYSEELFVLARRAERAGDAAGELRWLERAVMLEPGAAEPRLVLGDALFARGDATGGMKRYLEAKDVDPSAESLQPEALAKRAREAEGRTVRRDILRAATALYPEVAQLWHARADAERQVGDRAAAEAAARRAEALEAQSPTAGH
ncbi:MAG: serine hydrolase [Myxococcaceae bacterium]|nr:serine hydrolase [Myxococcaceae bacterium]